MQGDNDQQYSGAAGQKYPRARPDWIWSSVIAVAGLDGLGEPPVLSKCQ
jgi:hypothetical protein